MQNPKNSNIYQAKQAMEQVRRYREREAAKSDEQKEAEATRRTEKSDRTHTYRPKAGERKPLECRYCHEEGHTIKHRGKLTCPKLLAKEARRGEERLSKRDRDRRAAHEWAKHVQDVSGCSGEGWETASSDKNWRERQLRKQKRNQAPVQQVQSRKNPFDMGSDSEDETPVERVPEPREPLPAKGVWASGASSKVRAENVMAELTAMHEANKGRSWADMCDSEDEDSDEE